MSAALIASTSCRKEPNNEPVDKDVRPPKSAKITAQTVGDAKETLAVSSDPSSDDNKAALERTTQKLSSILEKNKGEAKTSLGRAREYAKTEYENNLKIMSEADARRQYEKDLEAISKETQDKGVSR